MDIQMPGLNGIEAAKIIKKIIPGCKIIFLTAYNQFEYAHEAIKLGVEDFIIKPTANERFLEVMKRTVETIQSDIELREKAEAMEIKLEQVSEYLEREFVSAVTSGDIDKSQADDYLSFFEIPFSNGMGIAIHIYSDQTSETSEIRNQMMKKRYLAKLEKSLANLPGRIFTTITKNFLYLLVFGESKETLTQLQNNIRKLIGEASDYFADEFSVYTDFGIGDIFSDPTQLWKSFSKARFGADKRMAVESAVNKERLNALLRGIQNQDEQAVEKWISSYVMHLNLHEISQEDMHIKLYEQCVLIVDGLKDKGIRLEEDSKKIFQKIMKAETESDVTLFLKELVHNALELVKEDKSDKTTVVMNKLITYINSHYNQNITLEQLSELCGLSTFYLSKVFKKHVNMNFSDYLAYVRIMVAKRLLKDSGMSMKAISMEVGYSDSNYFARVFKKYENMTPTEYRNRVIQGEDWTND